MRSSITMIATATLVVLATCLLATTAQSASVDADAEAELQLFAVEIKVGPNWDDSKSPYEQAFFQEHSANLKSLREAGHIVMGARYSDIGLVVFSAKSAEDVMAMMSQDPSMSAGTFKYEVHVFNVFYPGLVERS